MSFLRWEGSLMKIWGYEVMKIEAAICFFASEVRKNIRRSNFQLFFVVDLCLGMYYISC
jgi:hypothetical protein